MDLPVRIVGEPPAEPVLLVDGVFEGRGLNLSHWPGHRTPRELQHDLSTGSALALARLPEREQRRLTAGCTAIANNHYDTDGTCALFAARFPELALPRAERLLACARAGDFFQLPDLEAYKVDVTITELGEAGSPLHAEVAGLGQVARWQRLTDFLLEHLTALLDGDLEPYRVRWEPAVERALADQEVLRRARRSEDAALDLAVLDAELDFAPGRHPLHAATARDRILVLGCGREGTTARLIVSSLSWFELVTERRLARPDLALLAARLNEAEGTAPNDEAAWRAQDSGSPAPELWFGLADVPRYAEHNPALRPSKLAPARIDTLVREALAARS